MERPLTQRALEDAVVRHCAPVLLNAKAGSMFTFVGSFTPHAQEPTCEREAPAGSKACTRSVKPVAPTCANAHGNIPYANARNPQRAARSVSRDTVPQSKERPTRNPARNRNRGTWVQTAHARQALCDTAAHEPTWQARRQRLAQLVDTCDSVLAPYGVRVTVLAWRPCGAIVYAYRPVLLARDLADNRVQEALARYGYPLAPAPHTSEKIPRCSKQISRCSKRATRKQAEYDNVSGLETLPVEKLLTHLGGQFSCVTGMPHEIGFFLGYPYEDVTGFIEHQGRGFICFGCWKVYANPRQALRRFSQFKRCARRAEHLLRAGATLAELAEKPDRPQRLARVA